LKLRNNVGLTMALLDQQADLTTLLQESAVPGLRVMISGPLPPNPAEILGFARMREVLAALAEQAEILVLDSPPILAVADSAILASQVDGVLLRRLVKVFAHLQRRSLRP
jgi:Mrp family chromosome partitioning ATPase